MVNCPKCSASVDEEKAFCHNCGSPMNPSMVRPESELPDFSATMIVPPKKSAQTPAPPVRTPTPPVQTPAPVVSTPTPPAMTAAPPVNKKATPIAHPPATPPQFDAQPSGERKSAFAKFGLGFVLLLAFLMLVVFMLTLWLD